MKTESTVRQEHILKAAIRRFSHFGIQKTTLTEVADDLSMTKQSLHYYFPDKQSLIAAVEEKITSDYIDGITEQINDALSTEEALLRLVDVRKQFFEKYFMLAEQVRKAEVRISDKSVEEVKQKLTDRESFLLSKLFQKGIERGELRQVDTVKTAGLLLDTLVAFTYCISEKKGLPEKEDFEAIYQKQRDVMHLFYNGLKS
ncbi:MAG TPA: TetR/AcrR family transcriptional regulator [Flavisolibacter sp.]|nr:TetR/AcrR family transcriptional regulator [Flavisolibacter sp.]